jgi:ATP-binding cassette subfamily C protein LapB
VALVDLPFLVIFLVVIWVLGGVLVLIPITTMFLILGYIAWIKYPLQKSIEETHQATALKNSVLIESLVNLETIKYLGANGHAQWNWEEANGHISSKSQTSKLITASIPTVTNFMVQISTVIIVIVGVYEIYEKAMTMGALMGIVMLASRALAPMSQIAALSTNYENVRKSYTELNKIMAMPCERPVDKQFIQRSNFEGVIEFKDVKFNYPDEEKPSLIGASFKINKGEKVAIIGRIGSGKTTIQKLILGLYQPTVGSILIDGIYIKQIDPVDLRKHMAYVPQDIYLFKGTVRDNIIYRDFSADNAAIIRAAKISGVEEFVDKYPKGYDMPVGERGEGISGGQRQSIAIARAFINDTPMILLDEPTNMMDNTSEDRIKANIKEAMEDKTLVLVTHKKSLLDLVERIIVVDEGRIILDGPKDEVLTKLAGSAK